MSHFVHRLGPSTALVALVATTACGNEMQGMVDEEFAGDVDVRLGRVHVLLQPAMDEAPESGSASLVEITARFAYFHGLEEDFVRARADVPFLPSQLLAPGRCERTSQLVPPSHSPTQSDQTDQADQEDRELVLMDAGALWVTVGDTPFEVPVALVPDLLPYMSGVEYGLFGEPDAVPLIEVEGPTTVAVKAAGAETEALPGFAVEGVVPDPLQLQAVSDPDRGQLEVRWARSTGPDVSGRTVTFHITPLREGQPQSDGLTCVSADRGAAAIDLTHLDLQALPLPPDSFEVVASRLDRVGFDAGDLVGGELVVEFREASTIAWDE